jgi:hypothetical protein
MLQKSECSPTIDASPERSRRTRNPSISNAGRRGLWARKRCVRCRWLAATFDQTGWLAIVSSTSTGLSRTIPSGSVRIAHSR